MIIPLVALLSIGAAMASQARDKMLMHKRGPFRASVSRVYAAPAGKAPQARQGAMGTSLDAGFVRGLLWHHREPLNMEAIRKQYGNDPKLLKIAEDINRTQKAGSRLRKSWREKREKNRI